MEDNKQGKRTARSLRRIVGQRRRTHNVTLLAMIFLAALLLFLMNACTADKEYSDSENRSLSQKPTLSMETISDGSYFSDLTDWYNDQFVGRDSWISLNLKELSFLGRKESGSVYLCDNGYLIGDPEEPDTDSLTETISAMNAFAEAYSDVSMQIMLVPGAASVLSDYLPSNAPVRDQIADLQAVEEQLSDKLEVLNVTDNLLAHAEEYIYYKTDHHWTSLGAYYAFSACASKLGITNTSTEYTVYTVTEDFEGTLASKSGSHSTTDSIDIYVDKSQEVSYYVTYAGDTERVCSIYSSAALDVKDKYTVFFGGNYSTVEICTTANNSRNLLILKDSYANSFVQFLLPYYENIIMVDARYYYDSLDTLMTSYRITDVLYLYSGDTILTDTSLADVLNAAVTSAQESQEDTAEVLEEDTEDGAAELDSSEENSENSLEEEQDSQLETSELEMSAWE